MTTTPNLGITEVSANQTQKEVTINAALEALDKVLTESLAVDCTAGGTIALTTLQAQQYQVYSLTGTPAAGFNFQFPASVKRLCLVKNSSGKTATIRQTATPGTTVSCPNGQTVVVYIDGSANAISVASGATTFTALTDAPGAFATNGRKPVRVNAAENALEYAAIPNFSAGMFQESVPASSAKLMRFVFVEGVTFVGNFVGSKGHCGTNPTASFVIDVQKNGSSIGSITISTGGVFTFATTSGTSKSFVAGDRLDLIAPGVADATAALITITLLGSKDA